MEKTFSAEPKNQPRVVRSGEEVKNVTIDGNIPIWDGDLTIPNIQAYLIANGFEGEKFRLHHDEANRMYVINSAPFTNNFDLQREVVKEMGGEYDRDLKKSVFRY